MNEDIGAVVCPRCGSRLQEGAPGRPEDWPGEHFGLSPRESEIVALIALGRSNREVADSMFLGVNTIKTYIRNAYRKMGVTSRTQAVLWALDHGFGPGAGAGGATDAASPVAKQ